MNIMECIRNFMAPKPDAGDVKYETAIRLADEVTAKMRERANSTNPFQKALIDMIMGAPVDTALMADAFEAAQEARIYRGPLNGKG